MHFFVEGGALVGMGHISRVASLVSQFNCRGISSKISLFGDLSAKRFAENLNLPLGKPPSHHEGAVAVVDAVHLPRGVLAELERYSTRIVISPAFKFLDHSTHYFARTLPTLGALPARVTTKIDQDYAFVTAGGVSPQKEEKVGTHVGLCISAGASNFGHKIAGALLRTNSLSSVHAISAAKPPAALINRKDFFHSFGTPDPWDFFSDCGVFVGGDGLMVSEAVARGVPAFSLSVGAASKKNELLVSEGAIIPFTWADVDSGALAKMLVDSRLLAGTRRAASRVYRPEKSEKLAVDMLDTIIGKA